MPSKPKPPPKRKVPTFTVGQHVTAKLRRNEILHQGDDRIVEKFRYRVLAVDGGTIGIDDGDPSTRWAAELFAPADRQEAS